MKECTLVEVSMCLGLRFRLQRSMIGLDLNKWKLPTNTKRSCHLIRLSCCTSRNLAKHSSTT